MVKEESKMITWNEMFEISGRSQFSIDPGFPWVQGQQQMEYISTYMFP